MIDSTKQSCIHAFEVKPETEGTRLKSASIAHFS